MIITSTADCIEVAMEWYFAEHSKVFHQYCSSWGFYKKARIVDAKEGQTTKEPTSD